jgi:hypothetical protein
MAGVDTVGGVRVPAGFCGVIGFRPSYGAISKTGVLPVSASLDTVGMYRNILEFILFWILLLILVLLKQRHNVVEFPIFFFIAVY